MERQQNTHHRRHLSATLSKKFSRVHSFLNRTAYDDFFTAPIRDASREFSPRFADYTEIFNNSKASRASSIPVLDLPPLMDGESIGGVQLDYSSIFGGFDEGKFGASYEELFPRPVGDNIKDYSDFRNTDGIGSIWNDRDPKNTPSTAYPSNDHHFTMSFNKSRNKAVDESVIDVVTHITQIYTSPVFTHVNDSTPDPPENNHPSHKSYFDDPFENDTSLSPEQHKAEVVIENNEKEDTENKYDFMKPGSSRPESSEDDASQDRFDCCTETFSDEEINIDSAAAASADAVRKAIEVAGERIRLVRESVKKRNGSSIDSKFDFMVGMEEDDKTAGSRECQPNRETEAVQESMGETKDDDLCDFPEENDFHDDENIGKCEKGDEWRRLKQFYQLVNMCKNRAVSLFSDRANNAKSFAEDEGGGMPPTEDKDEKLGTLHQTEETSPSRSMNAHRDGMELNESWKCAENSEIPTISEQRGEVVGSMEVNTASGHVEKKPDAFWDGDGLGMSSTECPEDDKGEEILQEESLVDCWSDSDESFEEDEVLERKNSKVSDPDEPFVEMDDSSECIEASFTSEIHEINSESTKKVFGRDDISKKESNFLKTKIEGCDEHIISASSTVEPYIGYDPRYEDVGLFEMESTVSSETEFYGDMTDNIGGEDEVEEETYENVEEDNSSCGSHDNIGNVSVTCSDFDELEDVNNESCISDDPNENVDFYENMEKNEINQIEDVFHYRDTIYPAAVEGSPDGENAYESDETANVAGYEEEIVCGTGNLHSMDGEFKTSEEIESDDDTSVLEKSENEENMKEEESKVVENSIPEVREREYVEAREKAERFAAERSTEYVETINKLIRERLGKVVENSIPEGQEKENPEAREKAERLSAERRGTECVETINKIIRERLGKVVENSMPEPREKPNPEACEKAERLAAERASAEYVETINKLIRERLGKPHSYTKSMSATGDDAKRRSERAAVERATTEARERAMQKALSEKNVSERRQQSERQSPGKVTTSRVCGTNDERSQGLETSRSVGASKGNSNFGVKEEFILRNQAKLERHQRTVERVARALEEKNMRDLLVQKEQAEKNRLADTVGAEVKRWAGGKQGNLRALLSTLQYILGSDSGWQPIPLTDLVTAVSVKKAYRKATLFVHPDKLQQRGATVQQKYICEKVFDLLKDAWNLSRGD